jgi:YggT family protein
MQVLSFLALLIDAYSLVVLSSVILSWIRLSEDNPFVRFIQALTEPVLAPIRRVLPDLGGFDFSPMILLFGLRMLRGLLLH